MSTIWINRIEEDQMLSRTAIDLLKNAGYDVRRGSFSGTTDDRLDRWYVQTPQGYRPFGPGHKTRRAAWQAAALHWIETE